MLQLMCHTFYRIAPTHHHFANKLSSFTRMPFGAKTHIHHTHTQHSHQTDFISEKLYDRNEHFRILVSAQRTVNKNIAASEARREYIPLYSCTVYCNNGKFTKFSTAKSIQHSQQNHNCFYRCGQR